jgi:hypothetical protein
VHCTSSIHWTQWRRAQRLARSRWKSKPLTRQARPLEHNGEGHKGSQDLAQRSSHLSEARTQQGTPQEK